MKSGGNNKRNEKKSRLRLKKGRRRNKQRSLRNKQRSLPSTGHAIGVHMRITPTGEFVKYVGRERKRNLPK